MKEKQDNATFQYQCGLHANKNNSKDLRTAIFRFLNTNKTIQ